MTVYLDNAATTKIHPDVLEEMIDSLKDYGNSEGKFHLFSENAKQRINKARNIIANCIGVNSDEIIFTSGATEANNFVLKGLIDVYPNKKKIIISSFEHSSIDSTANYLQKKGYEIVRVPVDKTGLIDLNFLEKSIDDNTILVSIMWVNNEIGTIQQMDRIDEICSKHAVFLHSDAVQALGKVHIDLNKYKALKSITISAHKIYGPKGIGALILKKDNDGIRYNLTPLLHGGDQEFGYRAGTLSNELIVGFGKACEIVCKDIDENCKILDELEISLLAELRKMFGEALFVNNDFTNRIPGLLNVQIVGINNMILLKKLSPFIAASNGSNCSITKPSRTLKAIGLNDMEINSSIRLSLSIFDSKSMLL